MTEHTDRLQTDRLPFVLPDWTRLIWSSTEAREEWEPRIRRAALAWEQVERWSVCDGIRAAALQATAPDALVTYSAWAAAHGLSVLPLGQQGSTGQYASGTQPVVAGKPWVYRTVLVQAHSAERWLRAWEASDDATLGEMLGYPECCRAFFDRTWGQGDVDTTWAMALNSEKEAGAGPEQIVNGPYEANILLRWLGIRAVPHLPCSFDCAATATFARRLLACGCRHGFCQDMHTIKDMLQWSVEWDALHGIAEIRTPVVKASTRTDATASRYVVQRPGPNYPKHGATGNRFPYQQNAGVQLTTTASYRAAFTPPENLSMLNGFTTQERMAAAHSVILQTVPDLVRRNGYNGHTYIIDLGCGTGELVGAVAERLSAVLDETQVVPCGVDHNMSALRVALDNHPAGYWYPEDMFVGSWTEHQYAVALLMPGRLTEVSEESAAQLRDWLTQHVDVVVCYAYDDWLNEGGLNGLLARAQLFWSRGPLYRGPGVEVVALVGSEAARRMGLRNREVAENLPQTDPEVVHDNARTEQTPT